MGSSQSSTDKSETYTVDSSGKVARVSRNRPRQTSDPTNASGTEQQQAEASDTPSAGHAGGRDTSQSLEYEQANINGGGDDPRRKLSTLDGMAQVRSEPSDQLRLREMDEILTRMKSKYKPNSAEMAGKSKSVFEELERSLMHCYKENKDQGLKCAALSDEYRRYVEKQRAQVLAGPAKS